MLGFALVLAIRLSVPLTIFRWPLWGGLAAIAADTIDILIFQLVGFPDFIGYHELDKLLDLYYLTIEVVVVQGWPALPRTIASALFGFRLVGVGLFEITDNRLMLFVFPNLFEFFFFFFFYLYLRRYRPTYALTERASATWLAVLLVPKMGQEYVLHYGKLLDHAVAVDIIRHAIAAMVAWLRGTSGV